MSAKNLVVDFYNSDALINSAVMASFLHPEVIINWHSSKGFVKLQRQEIIDMTSQMERAYVGSSVNINHVADNDDVVAVRYSHYVKTIENPAEEMLLAHFMVFWEIKDGKLFRGYQMSQPS